MAMSNVELAKLTRSLFDTRRKRKEIERKEEELSNLLQAELKPGVFNFGTYSLGISEGSRDIIDKEKLITALGEDQVKQYRKTTNFITVTVTRKIENT